MSIKCFKCHVLSFGSTRAVESRSAIAVFSSKPLQSNTPGKTETLFKNPRCSPKNGYVSKLDKKLFFNINFLMQMFSMSETYTVKPVLSKRPWESQKVVV